MNIILCFTFHYTEDNQKTDIIFGCSHPCMVTQRSNTVATRQTPEMLRTDGVCSAAEVLWTLLVLSPNGGL